MVMPVQKPYRSKQDYATPTKFLEAVRQRLGIQKFSHDFAADSFNAAALTYFDEAEDALSIPHWEYVIAEGWGWLNPPFTKIGPWAAKCAKTGLNGGSIAFLVPAAVGSNWFRDYVDGQAYVLFLNGRLSFMPDKPKWLYPKDCMLCLYGPQVLPSYIVWNWRTDVR